MALQGFAQSITINFPDINLSREGMNEMVVTLKNDNPNIKAFSIELDIPSYIYLIDAQPGTIIKEHDSSFSVSFGEVYRNGKYLTSITGMPLSSKTLPQGEYELMRLTFLALSDATLGNNIINVNKIDFASSETISLPSKSFNINVVNDILFDITNDISIDISNTNIIYGGLGDMSVQITNNKDNLSRFLIGIVVPSGVYLVNYEIGSTLRANNPDLDLDFIDFGLKNNKTVIIVKGNQKKGSKPFPKGQYNLMKLTFTAVDKAQLGNYTLNTFMIHYDCGGMALQLPETYNVNVSTGSTNDFISIDFSDANVPQGGTGELVVKVNNYFNYLAGVQIEFILPDGLRLVDAQLGEKVKKNKSCHGASL